LAIFAGLFLFGLILAIPIDPAHAGTSVTPAGKRLAAVTALMICFWLVESIPFAAVSLIPLAAFPLLGIMTADDVSQSYMNKEVMLFFGGFLIALGIEKCGLHRRIALTIVCITGAGLKRVLLGFMLATAFLSMWISNTAATMMMIPIGLALLTSLTELLGGETRLTGETGNPGRSEAKLPKVVPPPTHAEQVRQSIRDYGTILVLGIAYAASIGGLSTLVGTPTNITFLRIWKEHFPAAPEISIARWMMVFVPTGAALLVAAWAILVFWMKPVPGSADISRDFFSNQLKSLGSMSRTERIMLSIFVTTALLWITRELPLPSDQIVGWGRYVEQWLLYLGTAPKFARGAVHDSTVAIAMSLILFFVPAGRDSKGAPIRLLDWQSVEKLPWGVLLMFGGGFAIAKGCADTGLSVFAGRMFAETVQGVPIVLLVLGVCLTMTLLTEFTSNVATVTAVMPILAGASVSLGVDPRLIMIPATISASCAFMLPIATPPNAIAFGTGYVRISQMARYGLLINMAGVLLTTAAAFLLLRPIFEIAPQELPTWATTPTKQGE